MQPDLVSNHGGPGQQLWQQQRCMGGPPLAAIRKRLPLTFAVAGAILGFALGLVLRHGLMPCSHSPPMRGRPPK